MLPAPRLELNWALLGSTGAIWTAEQQRGAGDAIRPAEHPSAAGRSAAQHRHSPGTPAGGGSKPARLHGPAGLGGSPALREGAQGPSVSPSPVQRGGRFVTHPLPWGADHFKSRWCLKCVIRGKKQNSRERRREGKRQRAQGYGPANNRGATGQRAARGATGQRAARGPRQGLQARQSPHASERPRIPGLCSTNLREERVRAAPGSSLNPGLPSARWACGNRCSGDVILFGWVNVYKPRLMGLAIYTAR